MCTYKRPLQVVVCGTHGCSEMSIMLVVLEKKKGQRGLLQKETP